ncbi:threonine/homoserine/homoserine lactone efflux protein [Pseudomonas sp. BIGb0408]|uniref:Threonine/homoserine/homoserine lactone efflux protein n=1 Tax=Phytopseudomonas flavescens TaxID=29435 RepID=A0A7Z0BPJ1_9GAMM|nr:MULTISPECIES: LysE family translocator [Pseudomonas]MCW2293271.1 threonine/homoserine/homoserine lactone efflux protein [Pseudomonas sp. BIGb0408]NYH72158.1 threonine/homoserine/homoserine lactone efflux protein [Pseudomonas flavescens]
MSLFLSMAAFALAASISPGPVNLLSLSTGARHGLRAALRHVAGATLGFTLLLVLIGMGLHELLSLLAGLTVAIQWAGVAFLFYLAWRLAADDGALQAGEGAPVASFMHGALMQWLNPKAWLAAIAGMGAFVADGEALLVWQFAAIYCVVCYLSLACWAYAGTCLQPYLQAPQRVRVLAGLLVASAGYLVLA